MSNNFDLKRENENKLLSNIKLLKIIAIILGILIIVGLFFLFVGLAKSYNNLDKIEKEYSKPIITKDGFDEFNFFQPNDAQLISTSLGNNNEMLLRFLYQGNNVLVVLNVDTKKFGLLLLLKEEKILENKILIGTDTVSGIHPKILNSIYIASKEKTLPYGNDDFTKECKQIISKVFEKDDLEILPMMSGTASNALALSSFLRSYGSILCHAQSHINKDEGGAPEFFSCGGKLISISNSLGRVTANELAKKIEQINFKGKQSYNLCGVSITQLAENGTIYTPDEIIEISKVCKKNNLYLHMDGARFSNALAFQKCLSPADITWKVGVDCLSLGATKNGAMAAEVIIFFNKALAVEAKKLVKQTGHVLSKTRFISAQLNGWFQDGLWIKLAEKANSQAKYLSSELSKFKEFRLIYETQANEVFVEINKNIYESMLDLNIISNLWSRTSDDNYIVRFVTSFETEKSEIDELLSRIKTFCSAS